MRSSLDQIVVGSRALHFWSKGASSLEGYDGDTDIWSAKDSQRLRHQVDFCKMPWEVMELFSEASWSTGYAIPEDLLAIKLSHLVFDIKWSKHKADVLWLTAFNWGKINTPLYRKLCEYWEEEFSGEKSHLSLYKTKDEFFDDFVPKKYEHDALHVLVAWPDVPVYVRCLKEGQEVLVDKVLFDDLPKSDKIKMFQEEIAVIALERWLVPTLSKDERVFTIGQAWGKSLHKVVTQLTKGWASRFIVENLVDFVKPQYGVIEKVIEDLGYKEIYMAKTIDFDEFVQEVEESREDWGRWGFCKYELLDGGMGDSETGDLACLEQEGGREGGAEDCHSVIRFKNKLWMIHYKYYSYEGYDLDYATVVEVEPKKVLVTQYQPV